MKKLIFVLAIFVAAPAFAVVVDLNDIGGNQIAIQYHGADPCNLPRAFGLDLTISTPGTFDVISGYYQGESTSGNPRYGIYPATIDINDQNGVVKNYGSPLADGADPGTTDQILPSSHIVLELASLYFGDVNAPDVNGTLCILDYSCNGANDLIISMTDEDTYRGGLVFEDGTQGDVNDAIIVCAEANEPNEPNKCVHPNAPFHAEWVAWGEPNCWCYQKQCRGDADGVVSGPFRVAIPDLQILLGAYNKPDLAIPPGGICADFDHIKSGPFRVAIPDLQILLLYYNDPDFMVPVCPLDWDGDSDDDYNFLIP